MNIKNIEDNNTDFNKVIISSPGNNKQYPYCVQHGAMNKVSIFKEGSYWRCLQGLCRAGCIEIK